MPVKYILFVLVLFFLITCDHGIAPDNESSSITGISGSVYFRNWPPADSIKLLKMVVFYNFPPKDILSEVLNDSAFAYPTALTESLPYGIDSLHYEMELKAGRYGYIVIAQQYGDDIFNDWRAVGQHDKTPADSLPTAVFVEKGILKTNIDIIVDFNQLPVQPF
ncbi:MAG: hypothetical protein KDF60_04495 [Calditrichaeota bacterium]|nr:hypothetical protein [Calditrichota bacterium]